MSTAAPSAPQSTIRVASIPASHVYVRHLSDPDGASAIVQLRDVEPHDRRRVPWGWWPPVMLDPQWLSAHAERFDLVHVHFGFDEKTPGQLREVVDCVRELNRPLVYTVHDLRNPHQLDPGAHADLLDVLVPAADALITLTQGAAAEIERRWHRRALVLPHPHVLELGELERPRPRHAQFVVGVHAKSLRASMDPLLVVEALTEVIAELPGARLRVDLHDEVLDPGSYWYEPVVARKLRALAAAGSIELSIHSYFTDEQLWDYLARLDVSVLPYRFGTHSGWLEGCYDLGTTVIAPDCGFYAEQGPVLGYHNDEAGLDADSLAAAVRVAYERRPHWQATHAERLQERRRIARAHRQLYERLLGG